MAAESGLRLTLLLLRGIVRELATLLGSECTDGLRVLASVLDAAESASNAVGAEEMTLPRGSAVTERALCERPDTNTE